MTLRYDLRINQGETFQCAFPVFEDDTPADLSGISAKAQIRTYATSPTVLYEWSTTIGNIEFSTNDVLLTVPAADSSMWNFRTAQWSLELTDGVAEVVRLVEGLVIVHPEITR